MGHSGLAYIIVCVEHRRCTELIVTTILYNRYFVFTFLYRLQLRRYLDRFAIDYKDILDIFIKEIFTVLLILCKLCSHECLLTYKIVFYCKWIILNVYLINSLTVNNGNIRQNKNG